LTFIAINSSMALAFTARFFVPFPTIAIPRNRERRGRRRMQIQERGVRIESQAE
jgi:hypothetical protein